MDPSARRAEFATVHSLVMISDVFVNGCSAPP